MSKILRTLSKCPRRLCVPQQVLEKNCKCETWAFTHLQVFGEKRLQVKLLCFKAQATYFGQVLIKNNCKCETGYSPIFKFLVKKGSPKITVL